MIYFIRNDGFMYHHPGFFIRTIFQIEAPSVLHLSNLTTSPDP
ncbi:MAG: hypothetical protein ABI405_09100 [Parafilimonas sp.]